MSMKKKLLIAFGSVAAAIVLVVTSVLGTVAYLTSSAAVSNVFTVGNVQIVMDESKVNKDGTLDTTVTGRVDTNTYHLVPGTKYIKDPQVRVNAGSENSYLFVLVRNDLETIGPKGDTEYLTIAEQMELYGWTVYTKAATGTVYVYNRADLEGQVTAGNNEVILPTDISSIIAGRNQQTIETESSAETKIATLTKAGGIYKLFDYFYTDPSNTDLSTYGAAKITLTAVAIQASGFGEIGTKAAVDAAWTAVKEAYPYIHTGSN